MNILRGGQLLCTTEALQAVQETTLDGFISNFVHMHVDRGDYIFFLGMDTETNLSSSNKLIFFYNKTLCYNVPIGT